MSDAFDAFNCRAAELAKGDVYAWRIQVLWANRSNNDISNQLDAIWTAQ